MSWSVIYRSAINEDGSLLFPEKLTHEFLDIQKKKLGSYQFAQQYLNQIIDLENQTFKKAWFKYYTEIPKNVLRYAMIDPAIGQKKVNDYTGLIIMSVDCETNWYVQVARRKRMTPTEIVNLCFDIHKEFDCTVIGIETIAYQEALLYMLHEEMIRRNIMIPIKGYKPPNDRTKEARIRSLVPRYEFGRIYHNQGLHDLESELLTFPRAAFDDISDPLSSVEELITYPQKEKEDESKPASQSDPRWEKWFIRNLNQNKNQTQD